LLGISRRTLYRFLDRYGSGKTQLSSNTESVDTSSS
jgi:hypothetical protein